MKTNEQREDQETSQEGTGQFLTFTVAGEEYGVDILKVQEIKGFVPTTRIPNAPPEVIGVLNLRGTVVPIVDVRTKFKLENVAYNAFTVIVVLVVQGRVMGIVVDAVSDVMSIPPENIQPAPDFGDRPTSTVIKGMGKVDEKLVILLDIDALLLGDNSALAA